MVEKHVHNILVGKPEGKRTTRRLTHRQTNNVKMPI